MNNLFGKNKSLAMRCVMRLNRTLLLYIDFFKIIIRDDIRSAVRFLHEKNAFKKADWLTYKKYLYLRLQNDINFHAEKISFSKIDLLSLSDDKTLPSNFPINIGNLSAERLLSFYSYFRYFGNYCLAQELRKMLLEKYLLKQINSKYLSKDSVNAAIELGRYDIAQYFLRTKNNFYIDNTYLVGAKALTYFLLNFKDKAFKLWQSQFSDRDYDFMSLVQGKTVAIVGPAPPVSDVGVEIDTYDLVIRTNYTTGSNYPEALYGRRTDISYYNHFRMAKQLPKIIESVGAIKAVVLKNEHDYTVFNNYAKKFSGVARDAFLAFDFFFQDSDPMAIQNILNDITRFSPSKIKLFCTNFYDSELIYSDNYRVKPLPLAEVASSLRVHELFSCFSFAKNFFEAGIFEADPVTNNVLIKSKDEYAKSIQKIYGQYSLTG